MRAALAIAAKDLRQRIRDRSAIAIAIVAPFGLAAMFALLIPTGAGAFQVTYAVVDADRGLLAAAFRAGPLAGLVDAGVAELVELPSEAVARDRVAARAVDAAIVIPAGFSDAVVAGVAAEIVVVGNVDANLATQVATSVASGFIDELAAIRLAVATTIVVEGGVPDPARSTELAERAQRTRVPIDIVGTTADSRQAGSATFYAASMAVFFLFFTAQFGVLSLLGERRTGTLSRIAAAPVPAWAIVLGKALATFVLAAGSMTVLVVASSLLLGARWGDPAAVSLLVLGVVVSAMGITALITTLTRTEEQAGNWNSIAAMVLAILGGAFFPVSRGPEFLQQASVLTPHAWFLRGIGDLAPPDAGISAVLVPIAALFAIGIVTGAVGLLRAARIVVGR